MQADLAAKRQHHLELGLTARGLREPLRVPLGKGVDHERMLKQADAVSLGNLKPSLDAPSVEGERLETGIVEDLERFDHEVAYHVAYLEVVKPKTA